MSNPELQELACAMGLLMVERYLLNELSPVGIVAFEAHTKNCTICAEGVRNGRDLIQGIKDIGIE